MMTQAQVLERIAAEWDAEAKRYYADLGRPSSYNTPITCPACDAPYYYRGSARADHLRWHLNKARVDAADFWNETHWIHGLIVVPLNTTTRGANQLLATTTAHCRDDGVGQGTTLCTVSFVQENLRLIRRAGFPVRSYRRHACVEPGSTPFALMHLDNLKFIYDLFAAHTRYSEAQAVFCDMEKARSAEAA